MNIYMLCADSSTWIANTMYWKVNLCKRKLKFSVSKASMLFVFLYVRLQGVNPYFRGRLLDTDEIQEEIMWESEGRWPARSYILFQFPRQTAALFSFSCHSSDTRHQSHLSTNTFISSLLTFIWVVFLFFTLCSALISQIQRGCSKKTETKKKNSRGTFIYFWRCKNSKLQSHGDWEHCEEEINLQQRGQRQTGNDGDHHE